MAVDEVLKELTKRSERLLPPARKAALPGVPDHEKIRARAHEIYLGRVASGRFGDAASDWSQAERELLADAAAAEVRSFKARRA